MSVRQIIKKYNLISDRGRARRLGQNFLIDDDILNRIAACCIGNDVDAIAGCDFVEIGPGPCGLTIALAQMVENKIICIEKDVALEALHVDIAKEYPNISFIYDDALNIDINGITDRDVILFGNLPYNVGTKILLHFIQKPSRIRRAVFMLQKEVVDRICADSNTKDYGYLSVMCQLLCDVRHLFDVDASSFYPKPKVVSSIVELVFREVDIKIVDKVQAIARVCFENRRKTLCNTLKKSFNHDSIYNAISELYLHSLSRPEDLSPSEYVALAQKLMA